MTDTVEKLKLKPMDVYSDYRTPLPVAFFCRQRKYSVEAVNLNRALTNEDAARQKVVEAELELRNAEELRRTRVAEAQRKMEELDV